MFANLQSHVLITGGSSGIGYGLAVRFADAGATVLVTGRDASRLEAVRQRRPLLRTFVGDIGVPADREALARYVVATMPGLDVVINNAGIQRRVSLAADHAPWNERQAEIDILLAGPVHLNDLLIPAMLSNEKPGLIVNVTSGGAYVPQPFAPIYAACKAALHSYTVTLRHALRDTALRVVELIPPAVATGLAGPGANHGAPVDEFCDAVFPQIVTGNTPEVGFGMTGSSVFREAMQTYRGLFDASSSRFPVEGYEYRSN